MIAVSLSFTCCAFSASGEGLDPYDSGPPRPTAKPAVARVSEALSEVNRTTPGFPMACERFLTRIRNSPFVRLQSFSNLPEPQRTPRFAGQSEDLRALAIQSSLAEMLLASHRLEQKLNSPTDDPAVKYYDIVFIGAGSAEVTAQLALQKKGVKAKILTLEASQSVAQTFFETRAFYLNSTDGPSESDERPLPNRGLNLNKIPSGLIQTSVIQTAKYAEAGELGDILNLNRFMVSSPILFGQRVINYYPTPNYKLKLGYPQFTINLASGRQIYTHVVIETSGLGLERSSASSSEGRAFVENEWDRFVNTGEVPRYFTASQLMRFVTFAKCPYQPFVGKEVIEIGQGDYAKVTLEYFERQGPPSAYKGDTVEIGRYQSAKWLAPGIEPSCDAFIGKARSRYLRGIPSALQKGRISPVDGRSLDVGLSATGRPQVRYVDGQGRPQVIEGDIIVDAIGFARPQLSQETPRDVMGELPVTGRAVIGRETYPGAFLAGVASEAPVTPQELANVDDNRVSLYLNLVRVEALMDVVTTQFGSSFGRLPDLPPMASRPLGKQSSPTYVELTLLNPNGFVQNRGFAREFMEATIESAFRDLGLQSAGKGRLQILAHIKDGQPHFYVGDVAVDDSFIDAESLQHLVDIFNVTPTFFSILADLVPTSETRKFTWTFDIQNGPFKMDFESQMISKMPNITVVANLITRGFRAPEPLQYQSAQAIKPTPAAIPAPVVEPRPPLLGSSRSSYSYRPSCFTQRMAVATPSGMVAMGDLRPGDEILSYDSISKKVITNRIKAIRKIPNQAYSVLSDQSPPIEVTPRHRFFSVTEDDYIAVGDMRHDDFILKIKDPASLRAGQSPDWESVERGCYISQPNFETVFDIELEGEPRNFFIEGILVHNVKALT